MQFATSRPPADSNPLTLLFPPAAPTPNAPAAGGEPEDGQAEFDQLFPDLAPAPSPLAPTPPTPPTPLAAAARAAYGAAGAESVEDPTPSTVLSTEEVVDAGQVGSAIVEGEGPNQPEVGQVDRDARPARPEAGQVNRNPRLARLAPRPARASLREPAILRPMGQEAPSVPGAPAPFVGEVPFALPTPASSPDSGDEAPPEAGLFPGLDGAADLAAPAPAPGALETAAAARRDQVPARDSFTRPLGFFTKPAAVTPQSAPRPSVPTLPAVASPDAVVAVASAPARELPGDFELPAVGTDTTADLPVMPATVASIADSAIPADAQAISAAASAAPFPLEVAPLNEGKKSFVDARAESVAGRRKPVGIDGAKSDSTMSDSTPTLLQHPTSGYVADASGLTNRSEPIVQSAAADRLAPAPVSTAHVAVEAVLHAADQVANREQTSVDLQFSVGGVELSVRVELHADQVRATFRTDSAELRNNLSHEWQSFASSSPEGEHKVRLAPPVFTGAGSSGANDYAGDSPSRHREQPAARAPDQAWSMPTGRGLNPASGVTSDAALSSRPPVASPTSRHLHTLA